MLQSVDTAPDSARQHLALELLQEQLAQATQLEEDLLVSPRVHLARLSPRLRRVLEDTANRQGKSVRLEICDAGRSVDRAMLERLVAPLEQLLRNAVVHGIELPHERRERAKPEAGTITVRLQREGAEVVITVDDDGAGLNVAAIHAKARQMGLLQPGMELTDEESLPVANALPGVVAGTLPLLPLQGEALSTLADPGPLTAVLPGQVGAHARALGGSLLPLHTQFFPVKDIFLKQDLV
jgi:chemotaxis protein histidine kinase CheA